MPLLILFRRVRITTLHPETLRLRSIVAEAKRYRLLGRTGIVSSLDRQN